MLTITIYEASGQVCTYAQEDTEIAARALDSLNPARIFQENRVLIGSPLGLGIYSGHRISRIDLEATKPLESLLPPPQPGPTAVVCDPKLWDQEFRKPDAPADYAIPEGELYNAGVQFGLLGNHTVSARITSEMVASMERINRISHILTQPYIRLTLPPHGVALLNPAAICRITLQPAFSSIPQDTLLATRIG